MTMGRFEGPTGNRVRLKGVNHRLAEGFPEVLGQETHIGAHVENHLRRFCLEQSSQIH